MKIILMNILGFIFQNKIIQKTNNLVAPSHRSGVSIGVMSLNPASRFA